MVTVKRLTVARFKEAIKGSEGIKARICERAPCTYDTLEKWLAGHKSLRKLYNDECNGMLGIAHSVVTGNIKVALADLEDEGHKGQVDSSDAKWYLSKKGKAHGFGEEPLVQVTQTALTLTGWREIAARRRAQVEELEE